MLAEDTQYFSSPSKKYISNPSQLNLKITLSFKDFMQCDLNSYTRGIGCFYIARWIEELMPSFMVSQRTIHQRNDVKIVISI
jgi:hypothetical protein